MGKPRQRAVDILGLQHQSGRRGSCASGRTSKESIAAGDPPHPEHGSIPQFPGSALDFVQEVGELAKTEGDHPDISFGWAYATVSQSTENIKGPPVKDFIMASGYSIAMIRSLDFEQ